MPHYLQPAFSRRARIHTHSLRFISFESSVLSISSGTSYPTQISFEMNQFTKEPRLWYHIIIRYLLFYRRYHYNYCYLCNSLLWHGFNTTIIISCFASMLPSKCTQVARKIEEQRRAHNLLILQAPHLFSAASSHQELHLQIAPSKYINELTSDVHMWCDGDRVGCIDPPSAYLRLKLNSLSIAKMNFVYCWNNLKCSCLWREQNAMKMKTYQAQ